jgi:thiol-disulfide isomerase/thioredoxin
MMIRQLFSILCIVLCLACDGKREVFVLQGKLEGGGDKMAFDYDSLGHRAHASVELQDGEFSLALNLSEPQVVRGIFSDGHFWKKARRGFIPCNASYLLFVAQPGQKLEAKGRLTKDFVDIYPGGDEENAVFRKYTSALHPVLNDYVNLLVRDAVDTTLTEQDKAEIRKQSEDYEAALQRIRIAFLEKHVSSVGGLWLMEDMLIRKQLSMEEAERLFRQVDGRYADLTYYKNVSTRIQGAKRTAVGQPAPSIKTERTYDGQPFDLEAWRGKYVLVDFWGTWCGACIAGMPEMKKFAAKHEGKLMLLGIAKESDEQRWRKYLDTSEWDWKQIVSGKGEENYVLRFNVQGFPTKILIGPDGRILKRLVGEEPGFYEELEQLIK